MRRSTRGGFTLLYAELHYGVSVEEGVPGLQAVLVAGRGSAARYNG